MHCRAATEDDADFLRRVYASTRADELDRVDWPPAQKLAFVEMQFRAQQAHYGRHFPDMDRLIVSAGGTDAGRLYLDRRPTEHAVVDIAVLPEHRGRGLGSILLADILDEAGAAGRSVAIHVEKFNPAMRLYRRLGFETVADKGVYDLMRWVPQANTAS